MRAEDRRTISCWRLAVALPHSAISATERPQPVQMLALSSSAQISLQGGRGRLIVTLTGLISDFCFWGRLATIRYLHDYWKTSVCKSVIERVSFNRTKNFVKLGTKIPQQR